MGRPRKDSPIATVAAPHPPLAAIKKAPRKTIIQRIFDVQAAVGGGIAKDKRNKEQGYDYTSDALIVETVRAAMIDAGIVLLPPIPKTIETVERPGKNGPIPMTRVWVEFILASADDIEDRVTVAYPGDAIDYGDKGVYKAMTGARKYFYRMTFNLASEDDPENDNPRPATNPPRQSQPQQQRRPEPVKPAPSPGQAAVQNCQFNPREETWKVLQKMGVPAEAAAGVIHEINPAPSTDADFAAILKTVQEWASEGQKWDPTTGRVTTAQAVKKAGTAEGDVRALLANLGLSKMETDAYCHRAAITSEKEWVSMLDYVSMYARDGYRWNPKTAAFEKEEGGE